MQQDKGSALLTLDPTILSLSQRNLHRAKTILCGILAWVSNTSLFLFPTVIHHLPAVICKIYDLLSMKCHPKRSAIVDTTRRLRHRYRYKHKCRYRYSQDKGAGN